jgi:hypothetical protein
VDNFKMNLSEIGRDGMDWTDQAEDRDQWNALVNTPGSTKCRNVLE